MKECGVMTIEVITVLLPNGDTRKQLINMIGCFCSTNGRFLDTLGR